MTTATARRPASAGAAATEAPAVYAGTVFHRRSGDNADAFTHRVAYAYLDVDAIPRALTRRRGVIRYRRADYLGKTGDLAATARAVVADRIGTHPAGPVRMLTTPRTFGVGFNPISLLYCFDTDGVTLRATIAEVTNTPWGERHAYVLDANDPDARLDKALHVSPFQPMDQTYRLHAPAPGEALSVRVESFKEGRSAFVAGLALHREPFDTGALLRAPALRTLALIYGHALGLWAIKRVRAYPHKKDAR